MPRWTTLLVVLALALAGCTKLGTGDSGSKVSTVEYRVTGHGSADIRYAATGSTQLTTRQGAPLPYEVTVHTVDHSETVYRVTAMNAPGPLGCSITVNGVVVRRETGLPGKPVTCSYIK